MTSKGVQNAQMQGPASSHLPPELKETQVSGLLMP